ncbi:MAG: DUF4124 domain-containing protein [Rhodanobacter sp.]
MRIRLLLIIATLMAANQLAFAQSRNHLRYQWADAQGLVHYSDSLNLEALKLGYSVINDQGIVVARVARELTPEEHAAANKVAQEQAAQQRVARELANREAQMLNAYPDEDAFRAFQAQQLATVDGQIRTTQANLRTQEKALTDLLDRAADLERAKEAVPKFLTDEIVQQRAVVTGQRTTLLRQQDERASLMQTQGTQLARYRELKAAHDKAMQ